MYCLNKVRRRTLDARYGTQSEAAEAHLLLLCNQGEGVILINGQPYPLQEGACFLMAEAAELEYRCEGGDTLSLLEITFDYLVERSNKGVDRCFVRTQGPFPRYGRLPDRAAGSVVQTAFQLVSCSDREVQDNRQAVLFQQLIHHLLNPELALEDSSSTLDIERTIRYMEQHYSRPLSRELLASTAGLSPWYYSSLFQKQTGLSPMAFLHELRLRRAKELLIAGKASVSEVAERCGFSDESYFRRRFKAAAGVTPLAFSRTDRSRIADLSYAYISHLLALGVIPCAAMVNARRELHRKTYHAAIEVHLHRARRMTPQLWENNLSLLRTARPDVILCDDAKEHAPFRPELESIAPCLFVPWSSRDWRSQLRTIAAYVRREAEAERWLQRYEEEAFHTRSLLERSIPGQSLMVLRIVGTELNVFGMRNVGSVLYEDLGLKCPYDISGISVDRTIDRRFLTACNPDIIALVVDRDTASRQHYAQLRASSEWLELTAVRRKHIFHASDMPWLEYSPLAHEWMIRELARKLSGPRHNITAQ